MLRPTYADLIPHLPRAAQVIYPKDTGPLLIWGDVFPGATVIEGGVGAGAFTIALLTRGRAGRPRHFIRAARGFRRCGAAQRRGFFRRRAQLDAQVRDLYAGFDETGVDRMFLDLAEPGRALAWRRARCGPAACWFAMCRPRSSSRTRSRRFRARSDFGEIESFETLLRNWHVKGMSVRPHFGWSRTRRSSSCRASWLPPTCRIRRSHSSWQILGSQI